MNEKNILSSSDVIHKNVVTLFATFMDETNLYFLMELCTSTLADVICRIHEQETSNDPLLSNARFIRQCAVYYFLQLLSGMEHLHGRNIIHRDLKPDNVLLTQTNCIKIADFGFATFQEVTVNSSSSRISSENTHTIFVGSPDYCCPEALNGSAVPTNMFDLWSFGCILYEFLTGSMYSSHLDLHKQFGSTGSMLSDPKYRLIMRLLPMKRRECDDDIFVLSIVSGRYEFIRWHDFFSSSTTTEPGFDRESLPAVAVPAIQEVYQLVDGANPRWELLLEELI